jgi:hypothetical protein
LPDGFFSNQKSQFGKFWSALDWKMLIYFMAIWNILQTFGIFYDLLVHFVFIWYILSCFGIMHQEKSGNPDPTLRSQLQKCHAGRIPPMTSKWLFA